MSAWSSVLLALGGVTLLVLLRRVELAGGSSWWRVLVPSWRFFEAEDASFVLEVSVLDQNGVPGAFAPAIPPAARGPLALLFAPEHNLRLACHDLVERWVLELSESSPLDETAAERLPSYALVRRAVAYFLRTAVPKPGARYQLRLREASANDADDVVFLSSAHTLD